MSIIIQSVVSKLAKHSSWFQTMYFFGIWTQNNTFRVQHKYMKYIHRHTVHIHSHNTFTHSAHNRTETWCTTIHRHTNHNHSKTVHKSTVHTSTQADIQMTRQTVTYAPPPFLSYSFQKSFTRLESDFIKIVPHVCKMADIYPRRKRLAG